MENYRKITSPTQNEPYFCSECKRNHTKGKIHKEHYKFALFQDGEGNSTRRGEEIEEKEFKVNDYITLKLEKGKTNIYVKGQLFNQCKFLNLNPELNKISSFDEIESVDEMELASDDDYHIVDIDPETKFWGHCSNLQVWAENNYNSRLLRRNLAFPLLKKLTDYGDPLANKIFKQEIIKRIKTSYSPVIMYLIHNSFLNYLDNEELNTIFHHILDALEKIQDYTSIAEGFSDLISKIEGTRLIEENLSDILNFLEKAENKYFLHMLTALLKAIKETNLIRDKFTLIWNFTLQKFDDGLKLLFTSIKETELLADKFEDILNKLKELSNDRVREEALSDLISILNGTYLVEDKFTDLLSIIDNLNDDYHAAHLASNLVFAIKGTDMLKNRFTDILIKVEKMENNRAKESAFYSLISTIKRTPHLEDKFIDLTLTLGKMSDDNPSMKNFSELVSALKESEMLEIFFSKIEQIGHRIIKNVKSSTISAEYGFRDLIKAIQDTQLVEKLFVDLVEFLNEKFPLLVKISNLSHLIKLLGIELFYRNFSLIKKTIESLFNEPIKVDSHYIYYILTLIEAIGGVDCEHKLRSILKQKIMSLLPFIKENRKCPDCKIELVIPYELNDYIQLNLQCPKCKQYIKLDDIYWLKREIEKLPFLIEFEIEGSKDILKNKIQMVFELYERYIKRWIIAGYSEEEIFSRNELKLLVDVTSFTDKRYLQYFSDDEIDELFNSHSLIVKLIFIVYGFEKFYEQLIDTFTFFPWKQSRIKSSIFLRDIAKVVINYASEVIWNNISYEKGDLYYLEIYPNLVGVREIFTDFIPYHFNLNECRYIQIEDIVSLFSFLADSQGIKILKQEIVNYLLSQETNGSKLFLSGYTKILDEDQMNQIISQLDRKILYGIIAELLEGLDWYSCHWDYLNENYNLLYPDLEMYFTRDLDPKFNIKDILEVLHRFLTNQNINLLRVINQTRYLDNGSHLNLRERFPEEFREELYQYLLQCHSPEDLLTHDEFDIAKKIGSDKYEEDMWDLVILKPIYNFSVIKDFFYTRNPDFITLLISKFKKVKKIDDLGFLELSRKIQFFYQKTVYIRNSDFIRKIVQILEEGDKEDLDCVIKLKFFNRFCENDFISVINNPKINFKDNFVEIMTNHTDLCFYIDFLYQYVKIVGRKGFKELFGALDDHAQKLLREELIIKLNTYDEYGYINKMREWLNKFLFRMYLEIFKIIDYDDKKIYTFKSRKFGKGYKNYLDLSSPGCDKPKLSNINEIVGFEELKNLKVLKLRALDDFDTRRISHLKDLELLVLWVNKINDVTFLENFPKLKILNLSVNKNSEPILFKKLSSLEHLNLAKNEIYEIHKSIGSLSSLISLYLGNNKIEKLPDTIGNLHSLEHLDLSFNKIKILPDIIGNLKSLKFLDLSNNPISILPSSITKLKSLKWILLRGTSISKLSKESLPASIYKLREKGVKVLPFDRINGNEFDNYERRKEIESKISNYYF